MNAVWEAWVPAGQTPARATVEAKLANADYKVEIQVVAALLIIHRAFEMLPAREGDAHDAPSPMLPRKP